ncbi:MCE family protein [Williamsia sterculiae]|uniref:Virulence factor Mce family protein n=1 Tax=Williamsia sterculiae TaxID=1344003 RepID=A0A1N7D3P0_9NOCA|nr:MCE family protein [Williamsia sterculiae]SIR70489.1 virulence factor Mce family protein [Williamsia sterculiae]
MKALRTRLLGLVFFIVVIVFIGGAILKFTQTFTSFTDVKLVTDSAGNALPDRADVKARGVVVGEVRSVAPDQADGSVVVTLGLKPDMAKMLPRDTTARILPKTLFGERYVALQVPDGQVDTKPALSNNTTIEQDRSGNALEIQQFFDGLLPVLKAIPPQDLNITLGALSKALDGNGEKLGTTVDQLNTVFTQVNDNMPELQGTLRGLASFSQTYKTALPDVIDALDTLRTTSNTLVEKQGDLRSLISTLSQASVDTTNFLSTNRQDLLDLFIKSEPLLTTLAKQSPAFGCTFKNFAGIVPESSKITGEGTRNPGVKVTLTFSNPRGRYLPNQDEPRLFADRGPICYDKPTPGRPFGQYPGGSLNDGSYQPPSRNPGPATVKTLAEPQFSPTPAGTITPSVYNDPRNKLALKAIIASTAGTDPADVPDWIGQIIAPTMQGAQVTVQ